MIRLAEISESDLIEIYSRDDIFSTVRYDCSSKKDIRKEVGDIGIYCNDVLIGVATARPDTPYAVNFHPVILPEHRKYARAAMTACLDLLFKRSIKVNVRIPETEIRLIKFALAFGFTEEGFERGSVIKDGKIIGRVILGMTREEFYE